jgi:hypothetical protein
MTDEDVQRLADAWEALRSEAWGPGASREAWIAKWRACKAAQSAYYRLRRERYGLSAPASVNLHDS